MSLIFPLIPALNLSDIVNAATARTNLGLAIGSNVQAYSASTTLLGNTVTGTGSIVLATSPTLATPVLGVAAATSLACPTFTSAAAFGFTPAAGSGFNVTLSGAGDFAVNASQLYVDTSAGNVGIGTASPSARVHAISTTEQLRLGYDASNYYSTTVSSAGAVTFNAVGASSSFTFSDVITLSVATPLISFQPTVNTQDCGLKILNAAGSAAGYLSIVPNTIGTNSKFFMYVGGAAAADIKLTVDDDGVTNIKRDASNYVTITPSSVGLITFDAVGSAAAFSFSDSVAIGVATPLYPLHVNLSSGDNQLYVSSGTPSSIAGDSYLTLGSSRADTGVGHVCKIRSVAVAIGKADLAFLTQPSNGVYTERMRIDNAGYVGIGTTVPTSALSVVGVVKMEASSQRRPALTSSNFGYSANYRTLMLGSSSTTYNTADTGAVTLAFGVDVTANAGGTFTGDGSELLFRNVAHFITPDSGNTNYQKVMTFNNGNVGLGGIIAPTAVCHPGASTTARASLCLPHGAAPTTPVNGDMWTTTAGLFTRINGVTNGVGDVAGPSSSVTGAASVFSGTTGKLLRASPTVTYYSVAAGAEDKIEFGATFKDFRTATDGATVTFDLDLSDQWQVTFAGNRTLAISNASVGQVITILRYQDATGNRTPTWWANIAWNNGLAPVDDPTASGWSMTVLACVGLDAYSVPNWKEVCRSTSAPLTGITTATDGATVWFDLRVSTTQKVTLGGSLRILALTSGSFYVGQMFDIKLTQDATGSRLVTWFNGAKWPGGSTPTLTTTAGRSDWFRFICTVAGGSPEFDCLGTSMNLLPTPAPP